MPIHDEEDGCSYTGRRFGRLVYEFLVIEKIIRKEETYIKLRNEVFRRGGYWFLLFLLKEHKESVREDFLKMHETIRINPRIADDMESSSINPIEIFQKYFDLILERKINVFLLLVGGFIDYCPSSYVDMSTFITFTTSFIISSRSVCIKRNSREYVWSKRDTLLRMGDWYTHHIECGLVIDDFMEDVNHFPVVVAMLWSIFEYDSHKDVLEKYIILDHFEYADTFVVFFKYMCSPVVYRKEKVPLYVVFLGLFMGNSSSICRELDFIEG